MLRLSAGVALDVQCSISMPFPRRVFLVAAAALMLPHQGTAQSHPSGTLAPAAYRALLEWAARNAGTDLRPPGGLCVMIEDSLPGYTDPPAEVFSAGAIDGVAVFPRSGCRISREISAATSRHSVEVPGSSRPGLRIRLGPIESTKPDGSYRVAVDIMQGLRWGGGYRCLVRQQRLRVWEVPGCTLTANH